MAVPWIPIMTQVLPTIIEIVQKSDFKFTSKSDDIKKQIEELQVAATQNADSVSTLATQFEEILEAINTNGKRMEDELLLFKRIAIGSGVIALLSIGLSVWSFLQ